MDDAVGKAFRIVQAFSTLNESVSTGVLEHRADMAIKMLAMEDPTCVIDRRVLIRELETRLNVYVARATVMEDDADHLPWLERERDTTQWSLWMRYREFLTNYKHFPASVVGSIDDVTYDLLRRLEDPKREGTWDRRGLVVGHVQSGKTSNYIGLINKAIDVGYKLIVVLAGMHDSLRSQTQLRIDEGVLGFDSQKRMTSESIGARLGVGAMMWESCPEVSSLTTNDTKGDFSLEIAKKANVALGQTPVVLVVKKNSRILHNLIKWATVIRQQRNQEGDFIVKGIPLLVIDDEADSASINTRGVPLDEHGNADTDVDPSRINGLIRSFLKSFEKRCYVGYTATPFANIFIDNRAKLGSFGDDLFPRSFIISLEPPTDYMGPVRVFGLSRSDMSVNALPITREVVDYTPWVPDGHKQHVVPGALPSSLRTAVRSFVISATVRELRGHHKVHNSMLIHVTRFTRVQARVAKQVLAFVDDIRNTLRYGGREQLEREMRSFAEVWTDYQQTSKIMTTSLPSWHSVVDMMSPILERIEVRIINGTASDALTYFDHREDGLTVIAVGGDKLSRGLTLEGLTVSYYLRASRMYDTLMQMGRWFGYRPEYEDLCRLFSSPDLLTWYRDITDANEELREEFEIMALHHEVPERYGLKVRRHPSGLLITARNKMKHGTAVTLSFGGTICETLILSIIPADVSANNAALEIFARSLGAPNSGHDEESARSVWSDVSASQVVGFLQSYRPHDEPGKFQTGAIIAFINAQLESEGLTTWTVAVLSGTGAIATVAGRERSLVRRDRPTSQTDLRVVLKRLVSPADEAIGLDATARDRALEETRRLWAQHHDAKRHGTAEPTTPSGRCLRQVRPSRHGLLLIYPLDPAFSPDNNRGNAAPPVIGAAISFPELEGSGTIQYLVNNVYWENEFVDTIADH